MNLNAYNSLNKTIWFYWDTGLDNAPRFVQTCVLSWKVINPDWHVIVISKQNIHNYVDLQAYFERPLEELPVQAYSDILRVTLLATHGGVWCDATVMCKRPLASWLPLAFQSGFFCFHRPVPGREIASWFLVAQPNEGLIVEWFSFLRAFWSGSYREVVKDQSEISQYGEPPYSNAFWQNSEKVPYFWLHYSFAYLIQESENFAQHWQNVPKITANLPHAFAIFHFLHSTDVCEEMKVEWQTGMAPLYKGTYKFIDYTADNARRRSPMGYLLSRALSELCVIYAANSTQARSHITSAEEALLSQHIQIKNELVVDDANRALEPHYALLNAFERGNVIEFEQILETSAYTNLPGVAKPLYKAFQSALKGNMHNAVKALSAFIDKAEQIEGLNSSVGKYWFDFIAKVDKETQVKIICSLPPQTISRLLSIGSTFTGESYQKINTLLLTEGNAAFHSAENLV